MLTVEQVKNNISNYKIENGIVIDKSNNQPVQDVDKILEVKSSVMMYREAKSLYDKRLRGAPEDQETYINKALKVYGLNDEVNDYPQNKIIREILQGDGSIQVDYGGNNLSDSEKFSFLCEPKKEYGLATIKYMAHQRGIDISNLDVSIDLSEFQKIGVSKVNIKYNKSSYQKKEQSTNTIETPKVEPQIQPTQQPLYQHPMANELNELEKQKQVAKQNNDEDAYKYAQSNIERIIDQNQATISPEKWDSLSIDEQIAFVRLKINESKILHDKDAFDYWNANLGSLEAKKTNPSIIDDKTAEKPPERPVEDKSDSLDFSVMINQLRTQNSQISSEYKSMLSDGYIDDNELAILISRLKDLSDNASVIKSMVTDKSQEAMIDSIVEMINQESIKMTTMQRGIEETNHSFGR